MSDGACLANNITSHFVRTNLPLTCIKESEIFHAENSLVITARCWKMHNSLLDTQATAIKTQGQKNKWKLYKYTQDNI